MKKYRIVVSDGNTSVATPSYDSAEAFSKAEELLKLCPDWTVTIEAER